MPTYYVRPPGGTYGAENGTSYDNAFDGLASVSGLVAGDTLYVCGTHGGGWTPAFSGSSGNPITVRFDYAADLGYLTFSGAGTTLNINGISHVTFKGVKIPAAGTTAGILIQGTTANIILDDPEVAGGNTRCIYILGNTHTGWEINRPIVTAGDGAVTSGIAKQAIYIWGNNATAGTTGKIVSPVVRSSATSIASDATNFVGIQIEDWNGIDGRNGEGLEIHGFHTGLRLVDSDSNLLKVKLIKDCDNGGLKSDLTGGGYGATLQASSTLNHIYGGEYDSNYQGYVDSSTAGGNLHYGAWHHDHTVNGISIVATGAALTEVYNFTIDHHPIDIEGHGFVVQNGGAATNVKTRNGHIVCDKAGANVQCVAISGTFSQIDIDYMNYYATNGASLGQIDVTEYVTFDAWKTALALKAGVIGDDVNSTNVSTLTDNGQKWWTAARPIGSDHQPFPDFNITRGGTQNRTAPFHPLEL